MSLKSELDVVDSWEEIDEAVVIPILFILPKFQQFGSWKFFFVKIVIRNFYINFVLVFSKFSLTCW
jgi:hypothetical protein